MKGFKVMLSYSGQGKYGPTVEVLCSQSQEALILGQEDCGPGDCEFNLQYVKRSEKEFFYLNKCTLTHTHSLNDCLIKETRFKKMHTPLIIFEKDESSNSQEDSTFITQVLQELTVEPNKIKSEIAIITPEQFYQYQYKGPENMNIRLLKDVKRENKLKKQELQQQKLIEGKKRGRKKSLAIKQEDIVKSDVDSE